jgi:hypothetical protein
MSAKVDNSAIQDGYRLYHHAFILSEDGDWAVVQQGMQAEAKLPLHSRNYFLLVNDRSKYARRYHWLSENVDDFVEDPHSAICGQRKEKKVLNMVAKDSKEAQNISVEIAEEPIEKLQKLIAGKELKRNLAVSEKRLAMPSHHEIRVLSKQTIKTFQKIRQIQPQDYEELLSIQGVGPAAVRALALIAEVVYGASPSWQDPAKFSFSHGGKDGFPFPVDRKTYDRSILTLQTAIDNAKLGDKERLAAMGRLNGFVSIK